MLSGIRSRWEGEKMNHNPIAPIIELAKELRKAWEENESDMGEMAAYHVACEQVGIDPDDGWDFLAMLSEEEEP